ncbi:MAG: hypothetical protein GF392_04650 [Candidatus Omnitrophica bacterium]|nr:hypothetical protein [Candidatus Omnitrophota bacterium]
MECKKERNMEKCNCSYDNCARKGICCDCLHYHRESGQMPACFFPDDIESGYDRSIGNFVKIWQQRKHL